MKKALWIFAIVVAVVYLSFRLYVFMAFKDNKNLNTHEITSSENIAKDSKQTTNSDEYIMYHRREYEARDAQSEQLLANICGKIGVNGCIGYFEETCNNGDYFACGIVAQLYRLVNDYESAIQYGAIACEKINHNVPTTTTNINGDEVTVPKNSVKQSKILECHNLGNEFIEGKHFNIDFSKAITPFEKACDLDFAVDCHNAGLIYLRGGNSVSRDITRAIEKFSIGCDLGYMPSCQVLMDIS